MQLCQTPIKKKKEEFYNQVKTEQKTGVRKAIREQLLDSQEQENRQSHFKQICAQLDVNWLDSSLIADLRSFFLRQDWVISEKRCLYLLPIIKKQSQSCQSLMQTEQSQANDQLYFRNPQTKLQSAIQSLGRTLSLLIKCALKHPTLCRHNNEQILSFMTNLLETLKNKLIRELVLEWIYLTAFNLEAQFSLLNSKLLSTISRPEFKPLIKKVQNILGIIFTSKSIKITPTTIQQVNQIFESHPQLYTNPPENNSMSDLYHFIKRFTQRISQTTRDCIRRDKTYFRILWAVFYKMEKVSFFQRSEGQESGLKVLTILANELLLHTEELCKEKQNCIVGILEMLGQVYENAWREYLTQNEEMLNVSDNDRQKELSKTKQSNEVRIQAFMSFLNFVITKLPNQKTINQCAEPYLQNIYKVWQSPTSPDTLTLSQFKFLIKHRKHFSTSQDINHLMTWCQVTLADRQCRNGCLKIMLKGVKEGSIPLESYKKLWDLYDQQRHHYEQTFDELTFFLLKEYPYPSEADIACKEDEVEVKRMTRRWEQEKNHEEFMNSVKKGRKAEVGDDEDSSAEWDH